MSRHRAEPARESRWIIAETVAILAAAVSIPAWILMFGQVIGL